MGGSEVIFDDEAIACNTDVTAPDWAPTAVGAVEDVEAEGGADVVVDADGTGAATAEWLTSSYLTTIREMAIRRTPKQMLLPAEWARSLQRLMGFSMKTNDRMDSPSASSNQRRLSSRDNAWPTC